MTGRTLTPGCFGWTRYHERLPPARRLPQPCKRCPFRDEPACDYLRPGRLDDIKFSLSMGQPFWCHVTAYASSIERDPETGEPPEFDPRFRMCEGAARWLDEQIAKSEPRP